MGVCFFSLFLAMKIPNLEAFRAQDTSARKRSLRGASSQANEQLAQGNNQQRVLKYSK